MFPGSRGIVCLYCFRIDCFFIFIHILLPGQDRAGQGLGFAGEDNGPGQKFDRASLQVWRGGDQWIWLQWFCLLCIWFLWHQAAAHGREAGKDEAEDKVKVGKTRRYPGFQAQTPLAHGYLYRSQFLYSCSQSKDPCPGGIVEQILETPFKICYSTHWRINGLFTCCLILRSLSGYFKASISSPARPVYFEIFSIGSPSFFIAFAISLALFISPFFLPSSRA